MASVLRTFAKICLDANPDRDRRTASNMRKITFIIFTLTTGLLLNCSNDRSSDKSKGLNQTSVESYNEGDFNGTPFADTCICDFHDFGEYKISDDNYNIYKRGKGWNPNYYSCSWTWGEDISNIIPDDSTIRVMKIHLLDLDKFNIPTDLSEFGTDSIKNYVIATYTWRKGSEQGDRCVFDPFKTGKYPKPPQWTED